MFYKERDIDQTVINGQTRLTHAFRKQKVSVDKPCLN